MFERCSFIMGDDESILIIVPVNIPKDEPLTIEVSPTHLMFRLGEELFADIECCKRDVYERLLTKQKVGLVEITEESPDFPPYISLVAAIREGARI
ncbi:MAG: hypothetical protein CMH28_08925 [Micavibrio sp.]|nr:hypothetical protein [Micavibrio sp.]|tara:strand:+ start:470 stop:757 length:288 start_codon:yes stop_codon:yes gene_type:complete